MNLSPPTFSPWEITEVHQLGRREGAPRPGHEPTPSPRAGHLPGAGHLLPMRGGGGSNWWIFGMGMSPWESGDLKLCGDRMGDDYRIFWD